MIGVHAESWFSGDGSHNACSNNHFVVVVNRPTKGEQTGATNTCNPSVNDKAITPATTRLTSNHRICLRGNIGFVTLSEVGGRNLHVVLWMTDQRGRKEQGVHGFL